MITVFCDGEIHNMTLAKLKRKKWNVEVARSNGYSHNYSTIETFDKKYIQIVGGNPTIWCTKKGTGYVQSSDVSFS